jgi:16S rRNA (cytosine1402-N4)-methyltransferase
MIHKPVLLEEVIESLNLKPGMTVVDGTLGAGGHSLAILEKIIPNGKLISIDLDKRAARSFEKKLRENFFIVKRKLTRAGSAPVNIKNKNDDQAFIQVIKKGNRGSKIVGYWRGAVDNYANIKEIVRGSGPAREERSVDAVLLDLGFNSDQIENSKRGFSFLRDGPLDMRYSPETHKKKAADIVNGYSEEELTRIFREYGEERFARRIAREILLRRSSGGQVGEIKTTKELVEIILSAVPEKYKRAKIHPATKVFQALRVETNQELENLKKFLNQAVEVLASKGILAVISFHSLEDRIVKNFFRDQSRNCICPPNFPKCVCGHRPCLEIITKKPIIASDEEIKENPRARSAKLRIAEKI